MECGCVARIKIYRNRIGGNDYVKREAHRTPVQGILTCSAEPAAAAPPSPFDSAQGYGGYAFRTHPRPSGQGFLRRRVKKRTTHKDFPFKRLKSEIRISNIETTPNIKYLNDKNIENGVTTDRVFCLGHFNFCH
jgi:hypothetical protein